MMSNPKEEVTLEAEPQQFMRIKQTPASLATRASYHEAPVMQLEQHQRNTTDSHHDDVATRPLMIMAEEQNVLNADRELVLNAARAVKRVRFRNVAEMKKTDGATITSTAQVEMNEDDQNVSDDGKATTLNRVNADDGNVFVGANAVGGGDKDYVGISSADEEEVGTYKTKRLPTLSHSEDEIIQQQQDQGRNALISTISLFLVGTWNWFYYFLVTIIFLNLVHFTDRRSSSCAGESVVREDIESVEVDGFEANKEEINELDNSDHSEQSETEIKNSSIGEQGNTGEKKSGESNTGNSETGNINSEKKHSTGKAEAMSPNTCSIQDQQQEAVEQAQEAIVAVNEKAEVTPPAIVDNGKPESNNEIQQQPQITVVLAGDADIENESDENDTDVIRRSSVDSISSDGNMGDTEDGSENKSSTEDENKAETEPLSNTEMVQKIISQVETMFSDEHLAKDGFLLKHVRRRSDGFVSLKLVAGLRKVKQISREFPVVLSALKDSAKLEINQEGTKVRRVEPLTPFLKTVAIKSKDKDTKQIKEKDNASSNDENQQPPMQIQNPSGNNNNKSASKSGNKENDNKQRGQNRRNSNQNGATQSQNGMRRNSSNNGNHNNYHQNRKSSTASSTSSNGNSRHNSFSKAPPSSSSGAAPHPADLLRNVYTMTAYSSSGEECQSPQVRRRGGSLPISALNQRASYHSPNSSPPNQAGGPFYTIGPNGGARPKSNSYCEGAGASTMSPWLQRRKASASSRLSQGELVISGVIRQPKGPDGTKGFASNYRALIMQERLLQQQINSNSAVSA